MLISKTKRSVRSVSHKSVCFIALRLEDEPLDDMSVELEGDAKCLPAWCELIIVCNNAVTVLEFSPRI